MPFSLKVQHRRDALPAKRPKPLAWWTSFMLIFVCAFVVFDAFLLRGEVTRAAILEAAKSLRAAGTMLVGSLESR